MNATKPKHRFYLNAKGLEKGNSHNRIQVEVWHDEGGANYLAGTMSARAICVSISPCEEQANGITIMSLTRGLRYGLEEVSRRNDKKMAAHLVAAKGEIEKKQGKAWDVVVEVLKREKMELI